MTLCPLRCAALALALLTLMAASARAGVLIDNETIGVTPDGAGGQQLWLDASLEGDHQNELGPDFGLSLRLPQGQFGVGGDPFLAVTQDTTPTAGSGEHHAQAVYKAIDGADDLLAITETTIVPDSGNSFVVDYEIENISGASITFSPRMITDTFLRDFLSNGVGKPVGVDQAVTVRSPDASVELTAEPDSPVTWLHWQEGDFNTILQRIEFGDDLTDTVASGTQTAGIGIQWAADVDLDPLQVADYSTRFTLVHRLDAIPNFATYVAGDTAHFLIASQDSEGATQNATADIKYEVTGANAVPPTDAGLGEDGNFSYVGTNPGHDTFTVFEDLDHDSTISEDEPRRSSGIDWLTPPQGPDPAADMAAALTAQDGLVTGASYDAAPPGAAGHGPADKVGAGAFSGFPRIGSTFALLTSGDADLASGSGGASADAAGGAFRGAHDATVIRLQLDAPAAASCLSFDFRFLSAEVPSIFNDAFLAELDTSDWNVDGSNVISAPHNYAFDANGKPITVNGTDATQSTAANANGTTYGLGTAILRASTPITPGAHTLYLSLFDVGDAIVDSAVLLDNLHTSALPADQCKPGVVDASTSESPPAVTPIFPQPVPNPPLLRLALSGDESDIAGGTHAVVATVGSAGVPVRWSVAGANPASGVATTGAAGSATIAWKGAKSGTDTLTAFADGDGDGSRDAGEPQASFTVTWLAPPVLGKTANVEPVAGDVFVKLPRGASARRWKLGPAAASGFIPLTEARQIPLGSTLDTLKGKVELQTAQTKAKSPTTENGQFYAGVFQFTQSRGANPFTDLTLNGALACTTARGPAAAAKKPRSRSLWGSERGGRYRTRGRHSTATVRGTVWLTKDTCGTTTTVVRSGTVVVRDLAKHRNVTVKQGHRYVARGK